jgi:uncharacterized surface protein with fasciclin (FAS1) repeats
MKSFLTSLLTLIAMLTAAALIVTFTGIAPGLPGLSDNLATAQTTAGIQPAANATPAAGAVTPTPAPTGNIIQTMQASGQFTQALIAISAAGLTQTLESGGPYTVFAPTDTAFSQVPPAQLQAVLADTAQLQQVLSYHVVSGEYTAEQLRGMKDVTSLQGSKIIISTNNGTLMVDSATVVQPDIFATNGVIQAINQVLPLPTPGASPTATPAAAPAATP